MAQNDQANILIVDDLPEKHLVYRSILEELGENLVSANSGQDALKQILKTDFAMVLLDVDMPEMDGFETAQLIRSRKSSAHMPIIFLTAFDDEVRTAQGYAMGAVDYIPTPVVPGILLAKVRVFVELFRMRQQVARQAEERARRSAAEESARRSAFLSDASRALASSLDFETTLQTLARLAVPHLADLSLITLASEHGSIGRTACSLPLEGGSSEVRPAEWLSALIQRAVTNDRLELLQDIQSPAPLLEGRGDDAAPASPYREVLVMPLSARGRTLGALTLALGPSSRHFNSAEIALAMELSGRAGIALDNAMLVRDIQENDRRKNEFLAMLAHELRNPLAPIRTAVHLLKLNGQSQSELNWARDVIDRQVMHLVRLVDDLLDVSRITRGKIKLQSRPLDVAELIATAVETSRPIIDANGHEFIVSVPPQSLRILGDPTRLSQVLSNLLNNAAKYTPSAGHIWLTVEVADDHSTKNGTGAVRGNADVRPKVIEFRVRDTGIGIPSAMLSRIFDLFTQVDCSLDRAQGGLGIGLTMVRQLVELHGGSVHALSDGPGCGSEFVIRLPLMEPADRARESDVAHHGSSLEAPSDSPSDLRRSPALRMLVVDDNVDAAESLAELLRLPGHQVTTAHDGLEAMDVARAMRPEVIFLDIGLPGLDGYEVARRLRADPEMRSALLIAVSGYNQIENLCRSDEAGFDYHFTKPIDFAVIEKLLATQSREAMAASR